MYANAQMYVSVMTITYGKSLPFYRILLSPGYFQQVHGADIYQWPNRGSSQIGLKILDKVRNHWPLACYVLQCNNQLGITCYKFPGQRLDILNLIVNSNTWDEKKLNSDLSLRIFFLSLVSSLNQLWTLSQKRLLSKFLEPLYLYL